MILIVKYNHNKIIIHVMIIKYVDMIWLKLEFTAKKQHTLQFIIDT